MADAKRVDELFDDLSDRLDPDYGRADVLRAFRAALMSRSDKGGPAEAARKLAAELRAAAEVAEEIARLTG